MFEYFPCSSARSRTPGSVHLCTEYFLRTGPDSALGKRGWTEQAPALWGGNKQANEQLNRSISLLTRNPGF